MGLVVGHFQRWVAISEADASKSPKTESSVLPFTYFNAFRQALRPVFVVVSFPRPRGPVVGALGLRWLLRGVVSTVFAAHTPPRPGHPPHASPCFRVREAHLLN